MLKFHSIAAGSALFLSLVMTPLVIRISRRLRLFDPKNARTGQSARIPRTGGIALYLSVLFVASTCIIWRLGPFNTLSLHVLRGFVAILSAGTFVFVIGLVDDTRGLKASTKILAQLLAASVVCGFGVRIESIPLLDYWQLGILAWPISFLWIIGISNAFNLIDGLDGLAAAISLMTCGVIATLAISTNHMTMGVITMAMAGSLLGFLVYNVNPARIFLGESGSMFLGFMLASLSLLTATKVATLMGVLLPLLFLGFPIFDMAVSFLRRVLDRGNSFPADGIHARHKRTALGLKQRHAAIILYAVTLLIAAIGVGMMLWRQEGELVILALVLFALAGVYRLLGVVSFGRLWKQMTDNIERIREINREQQDYETIRNRFRAAWDFEHWWRAVRRLARRLEFTEVTLVFTADDGTEDTKTYLRARPNDSETVCYAFTCQLESESGRMRMQIKGPQPEALESMGRRLTLLGRLLDEHPVYLDNDDVGGSVQDTP